VIKVEKGVNKRKKKVYYKDMKEITTRKASNGLLY
jgi:hypothetical protein